MRRFDRRDYRNTPPLGSVEATVTAAEVNIPDAHGRTPLLWAASWKRPEETLHLLEMGADSEFPDSLGNTALMLACSNGGSWPASEDDPPSSLLRTKQVVEILMHHGAKINVVNRRGQTALMEAAASGAAEIVPLLLAHGAAINLRDQKGKTSLHHAVWSESVEAVQALLTAQADLFVQDKEGYTALGLALMVIEGEDRDRDRVVRQEVIAAILGEAMQIAMPQSDEWGN